MSLGERLLSFRKSNHLSQEEVADKLNVTRQTISKWETDQSTPDFDKIAPLCKLYEITADELLTGIKSEVREEQVAPDENKEIFKVKRAKGIGISVLLYFVSVIWIMIAIPVINMNPVLASAIFLGIIAIATSYLVYICIVYKKQKVVNEKKQSVRIIEDILTLVFLLVYFIVSFVTMAWHITWLIWLVYVIALEIVKLIFSIKGDSYEK